MSAYYPEGFNMNDVDGDYPRPFINLPDVPNPLDIPAPDNIVEAGEKVAAYLRLAADDTGYVTLQWQAAQTQIFPWSIPDPVFRDLVDSLPDEFPTFDNDAEANEFMWNIENALTKIEDD